ncbi:MAG: hypothetical protein RIR18_1524 [Pseudomonadota bacterium]|jgi:8-amino-7-oxononanoate synthase
MVNSSLLPFIYVQVIFLNNLHTLLSESLAQLASSGLARRRHKLESSCGRTVIVDGRSLLNFASNDYLGLANHPDIAQAIAHGATHWGAGSGASHLVSGHLVPHDELEQNIARFVGFPSALTFSTGYLANLAVTPTLAGRGTAIFADKLNHASLIDAMQLAKANGAKVQRYPHKDVQTLERQLSNSTAGTKLIVTDSVFSMDGDLAPLPALLELAEQFDAWLIIDDAHGFGVLGPQGEGALAHFGLLPSHRVLLMGTLGKAAGVAGAFVAGSELAIEYLLQKGRSYIFTTAAPPSIACGLTTSLKLIETGTPLRANLFANIKNLQEGLRGSPHHLLPSPTAIQPLIIGENQAALTLSNALWEQGIWVPAIRPPTVPAGTARLRISISAAHTEADIQQLVTALKELA